MATFPTSLHTFTDKSTANDVSGTDRINGADINAIQNEIAALEAKVGVDGSADTDSHDYKIAQLEAAKRVFAGSATCDAGTSTTVSDSNCTSSSKVLITATSSGFAALTGVYVSAVASGSFTVTHSNAAGTETFDYIIVKD